MMKNPVFHAAMLITVITANLLWGRGDADQTLPDSNDPVVRPDSVNAPPPQPGDRAPDFALPDQNNIQHRLPDYLGKWIVLYFYPKDMTPGCTTEACNFRDSFMVYQDLNAVILGVSKDSVDLHREFSDKYALPFPLLSDQSGKVCQAYGVLKQKMSDGKKHTGIQRSTFLIDPEGKIAKVYRAVDVARHAREVIEDIRILRE